jgi:hypothetical protein
MHKKRGNTNDPPNVCAVVVAIPAFRDVAFGVGADG